jgi:hypothetical protein
VLTPLLAGKLLSCSRGESLESCPGVRPRKREISERVTGSTGVGTMLVVLSKPRRVPDAALLPIFGGVRRADARTDASCFSGHYSRGGFERDVASGGDADETG